MSKSKPIIKIRKKPSKPKRKRIDASKHMSGSFSLKEMIKKVEADGITDFSRVTVHTKYYDGYVYLTYTRFEHKKEYAKRIKAYEKKLAAWEKWYTDNKQKIEDELARQKEEIVAANNKKLQELDALKGQ